MKVCVYYNESNSNGKILIKTLENYKEKSSSKIIEEVVDYNEMRKRALAKFDVILAVIDNSAELTDVNKIFASYLSKLIILTSNVSSEYIVKCIELVNNICFLKVITVDDKVYIENIEKILRKMYVTSNAQDI